MIFQHANVSNAVDFIAKIKRGNYSHLLIRMTGTNNTGQTCAVANLGTFWIQYKGRKIIQVSSGFLSDVGNQYAGYLEAASTISSTFAFTLVIPFYLPEWKNSLFVENDEECYIGINFGSTMTTVLGANNLTTYINAIPSNIPMTYLLKILNADRSSVNGRSSEPVSDRNVVKAYLSGTYITDVFVSADGEIRYNGRYADIKAGTSWRKNIESALVTYLELNMIDNVSDFANKNCLVEVVTSQSDTVYLTYMACEFPGKELGASQIEIQRKIQAKLEKASDLDVATVNRIKIASAVQNMT